MNTLKALKKRSMLKILPASLILFAVAIVAFFGTKAFNIVKTFSPKDLYSLETSELLGSYVESDIYFLYGEYAYIGDYGATSNNTEAMESLSVVIAGKDSYLGMEVPKSMIDDVIAAQNLCFDNFDDPDYVLQNPIHVKGIIEKMDSDEAVLYDSYLNQSGADTGNEERFSHYVLLVNKVAKDTPMQNIIVTNLICLVIFIVGLGTLVSALIGKGQKNLKATLAATGNMDYELEKLDNFYQNTTPINGFYINNEYVLFQDNIYSVFIHPWDIVWVYSTITQHRYYGIIKAGKTFSITICEANGKQHVLPFKKDKINETLEMLKNALPGTVFGYSNELAAAYKNNRTVLMEKWNQIRSQQNDNM